MVAQKLVVQYNIEQIYLELARSAAECGFVGIYRKPHEPKNINYENNIRFAGVAISISFAYAAMEAFCNAHLHSIYTQMQLLAEGDRKAGWKYEFRCRKDGAHFLNDQTLKELLREELKEKLKILASALNIASIGETDKLLWRDICDVARCARNFVIHPDPGEDDFDAGMKRIMQKHRAGKYADVAEKTIRHFYEKRKPSVSVPDWLGQNKIFRFLNSKDIERAWDHQALV